MFMIPNLKQLFDLTNRHCIVTGGSRGLGREMAEGLAEAGASLMLCARRDEWLQPTIQELRARGFQVEGMLCDVADAEQVKAVVNRTIAVFGAVDVLVNNAGISWGAPAAEMPVERWRQVLDVNLTGAFLFAQAAGGEMLKRGKGSIINVASVAGLIGSTAGFHAAGYTASKAGLIGLTRELAAEWGRSGVRVNAVAPGFFHSRLADGVIEKLEPHIERTNPIPRVGLPGELKGAIVFLASDAAGYITGHTLVIDGGGSIA